MRYFGKVIKSFIKTPQILLAYLLLLAVSNIYIYKTFMSFWEEFKTAGAQSADSLYFCGDIRYLCIVFFVCWFFISFEAAKKTEPAREIFTAMGSRSLVPYISQMLALLFGIFLFTANVAVYAVAACHVLDCPPQTLGQMIKVIVVDVFLLSVASSGMGLLVSAVGKKIVGYIIFLILIFYMIPDYYDIIQDTLPFAREIMEKIHNIICFLPPDVTYLYDGLYGLPFERYRLMSMLFWGAVGCFSFVRVYFIKSRTGKRIAAGAYGIVALIILLVGLNQGSALRMDDELRDVTNYYAAHEGRTEPVNYSVKDYQINFRIGSALSAECKVHLQGDTAQEKYLFTLYHGYRVKYIKDAAGNDLDFAQEGDYITVYAQTPTEYLDLYYRGDGGIFYSNRNACFLPGFFAYYPRSGFVEIFDMDSLKFSAGKEPKAQFDIEINGAGKYVVNLPEKGNRYMGDAENVTIVNGNYEEITDGAGRYIALPQQKSSYSLIDAYRSHSFQNEVQKLMDFLGDDSTEIFQKTGCVIVIPGSTTFSSQMEGFYATDSCVLLSGQCRPYSVLKDEVGAGAYDSLKNIFFEMEPDENFDIQNTEYHKNFIDSGYYTKRDELYDAVLDKMNAVGVKETARKIWKYISAEDYRENIDAELSFIHSI